MLSYYSSCFVSELQGYTSLPVNNDKCKNTFMQHHFPSLCLSCGWIPPSTFALLVLESFFYFKQDFFNYYYFFPSSRGPVSPPSREPNEQSTCLNSYRIFISCRAAEGMLCLFWCRDKFCTRTVSLQSGPSLSLSRSQGK